MLAVSLFKNKRFSLNEMFNSYASKIVFHFVQLYFFDFPYECLGLCQHSTFLHEIKNGKKIIRGFFLEYDTFLPAAQTSYF